VRGADADRPEAVPGDAVPGRPPELVIFDCDGTLVDTEGPQAVVLAAVLTEFGAPTTAREVLDRHTGAALEVLAEDAERRSGVRLPEEWIPVFRERRAEAFQADGIPAVPGARAAVEAVRAAGIPYGVASQGRLDKTAMTLRLAGLDDLFPEPLRFSAFEVARPKPAPDLFLHAARVLGGAPERAVVVEDSVPGARAGHAAGMRVLGYAAATDAEALRAAGAEPFGAMAELPRLLGLRA
jgi:HAD superfamily hydrolase (TIGR01509 family)